MLFILLILIILYLISIFFNNENIKYLIENTTKILYILGIIGIFELLREIESSKKKIIKDIEETNKSIGNLMNLSENLNIELIKHIGLDLKRDQKFLTIMEQLEKTLGEKINMNDYGQCLEEEKNI